MAQTTQSTGPLPSDLFSSFGYQVCREWGWVAFRGVLAILLGFAAFFWPVAAMVSFALVWGVFVFADGIGAGMAAWRLQKRGVKWWPYLLLAVVSILAGVLTFLWPGLTALGLVYLIAFWAIFGGASQIAAAVRLRKEIQGEWFLIFAGIVGVLFGVLVIFSPFPTGFVAVSWMIGFYAWLTGALYLMLAFKLRGKLKGNIPG